MTDALAALRIGLAAFGAERTVILRTPRFAELLGVPAEDMRPGLSFAELLAMAAATEFAGPQGQAFLAEQAGIDRSRPATSWWSRPDGRLLGIASDPLANGWIMTVGDMTRVAEAGQEASERVGRLESLLACIPQGVCVYGPDRRVVMFNRAYVGLMDGAPLAIGDHLEEVIRRRAEEREYGPGSPDEVFAQQMAFDISRPQMRRRRRPNGMVVDVRTAPMPDGGHVSVVSDITPLTQAEDELARRAAEMDSMLASIRHGIMLWGADRTLIASNPVASELLGVAPGVLAPGRSSNEIVDDLAGASYFGTCADAAALVQHFKAYDWRHAYHRRFTTPSGRSLEAQADPKGDGRLAVT
ncbi:MAG: PAS-domain containing protein, partial [Pseudomonadota bacterium]|nr:PAS-domain containing protein [Pseudomonadota bacterium]